MTGVTGSLALSKEALFLVSLAAVGFMPSFHGRECMLKRLGQEEFIKKLVRAGRQQADAGRRNLINYRDMCMSVYSALTRATELSIGF